MRRFTPKRFIDYFDAPYPKQVLVAKAIALSDKGITIQGIALKTDVSRAAVRNTIAEMYKLNLIYISHWVKLNVSGYVAAYTIGQRKDAKKPMSVRAVKEASKREKPDLYAEKDPRLISYYKALAKALAPRRSADEQRKVNSMYLNWITGGAYECQ